MVSCAWAQRTQVDLGGEWRLALDPVQVGATQEWFQPSLPVDKWDKVTVPHSFSVDPRYHQFTGSAWYRKTFKATRVAGNRAFVRFESVYYTAQVWLNGVLLGKHEGGYTPFEFDVTDLLAEENSLVVHANNAWSQTTIPGAKTKVDYQSLNYGQMFPWMNYGGIIREVSLVSRPEVYLEKLKIETIPDLERKTAKIKVAAVVRNRSEATWKNGEVKIDVLLRGLRVPVKFAITVGEVAARADGLIHAEAEFGEVQLWNLGDPVLYRLEAKLGKDLVSSHFGIRKIEIRGTKFFLNGDEVALGGVNRPLDAPGYGSMDPTDILERDMRLIKSGNMELSRLLHYPGSTQLMDWADEHGMLLIGEAGNWQMTPEQLADPVMQEKFRAQMQEMVERDWNHPSLIGWSVGNEYPSQTPEGIAWTRTMKEFVQSLDASRFITFASNALTRMSIKRAEQEASHYVDFVSVNIYDRHREHLATIRAVYADKPIYVSEFGIRADAVKEEGERIKHLREAMAAFREFHVMGASVWTFNDYQSIFPGSDAKGYRPWGLVSAEREIRGMYTAVQEEFCPAVVTLRFRSGAPTEIVVKARNDFPRYTLRGYRLRAGSETFVIDNLPPGEEIYFPIKEVRSGESVEVALEKPNGFVALRKSLR
ncbi:glycoside hydrolase family 2 protein [Oleiharenicola lentus]|uniref:glycoside hydrolase family 2 protein n=1 Tax=Oleiharenicola lentus TaxID=2508720 RepID=UPI003F67E341